jgi:hypothetical protein
MGDVFAFMASVLERAVNRKHEERFGVGGLLADENLALQGFGDCHVRNAKDGRSLLVVEYKRRKSYNAGNELWYHKSRGAQLYGALFQVAVEEIVRADLSDEKLRPVVGIILVPSAFKAVLLEPVRSDQCVHLLVHLYPSDTGMASTESIEFVEFIAMCLLRGDTRGVCTPPLFRSKEPPTRAHEPSTEERIREKRLLEMSFRRLSAPEEEMEASSVPDGRGEAQESLSRSKPFAEDRSSCPPTAAGAREQYAVTSILLGAEGPTIWTVEEDELKKLSEGCREDDDIEASPSKICI